MGRIKIKLKELKVREKLEWSPEQINMKDYIIDNYDTRLGIIKISSKNEVLDGNHRYTILLNHYGGEHEVEVYKSIFPRWVFVILWFMVLIVSLPVVVPYVLFKQIANKFGYFK